VTALAEIPEPETPLAPEPRLVVRELSLSRRGRILLDDVSLDVGAGQLVGLFGPPGAGKAVLIDWLAGLIRADRGSASFDGVPIGPGQRRARDRIGLVLAKPMLDPELTCIQNLRLAGQLYGVPRRDLAERSRDLLAFLELEEHADDAAGELAPGYDRRLELARALIHDPSLLLICEPFRGLRPRDAARTWQRFAALRELREITILLGTGDPSDAAHCDRVTLLDRGLVIATDTPAHLLSRVPEDVIELEAREPELLARELAEAFDLIPRVEAGANRVLLDVDRGHELIPRLVDAFPARRLDAVRLRRANLTDVFAHLTGHAFAETR